MINNVVGSDVFKENFTVKFPAATSGAMVNMSITICIIDDNTPEEEEEFYLLLTNNTSLNQSSSPDVSDDVQFRNRVALVHIYDDDDDDDDDCIGKIVSCDSNGIASQLQE